MSSGVIHLHSRGRGGNQLFQLATAAILAEKLCCDLKVTFIEYSWYFADLFAYSIPYAPQAPIDAYHTHKVELEPIVRTLCAKQTYAFCGWFESWTLLSQNLGLVKRLFAFKTPPILVQETIVHIRLGDVADRLSSIPEYPHRIVSEVAGETAPITLLSDSLDSPYVRYCRDVLRQAYPYRKIEIASPDTEVRDFMRMVQCQHLVGSNSTFVFWAGLLGSLHLPEKKTTVFISNRMVAPERTQALYIDDVPTFCTVIPLP
jgi:hypothetical protein